jgi:GxxExxY protein
MLIYKREVFLVMGAAFEVYKELGPGFLEAVYHEAMEIELAARKVPFKSCHPLQLKYKGKLMKKKYVSDFVCFDSIIVELKAQTMLSDLDHAQLINYLKGTGIKLGLLLNFGSLGRLEWKRLIR